MIPRKPRDHSRGSIAESVQRWQLLPISPKEALGALSFSRSRPRRSDQESLLRLPAFDRLPSADAHGSLVLLRRILRAATLARVSKPFRESLFHLPGQRSQSSKDERRRGVRFGRLQSLAGKS